MSALSVPLPVRTPSRTSKRPGFTLIELVVTLAVASILLAVAAPAFHNAYLNSVRASRTNTFVEALSFARSQAVALRRPVVMCRSDNPMAAVPHCSGTQGWEDGWLIFLDRNRVGTGTTNQIDALDADSNRDGVLSLSDADLNGDRSLDASDAIIRRRERLVTADEADLPAESRYSLRGNANVATRIAFDSGGISANNGTIVACDARGFGYARVIVVSTGGRIQSMDHDDTRVPPGIMTCLR